MKGTHQVKVSRKRGTVFTFEVRRNITVVRGDSGTGKTTLFNMIADHMRMGERSGVTLQCDCPCIALTDFDWRTQLSHASDSIVFVDEGFEDILTHDFAGAVQKSSNYFVIFCRAELPSLPYSVNEVYRIKTSGKKYHTFVPLYKELDGCRYTPAPRRDFEVLLVEDSKSGMQFFSSRFQGGDVRCESAGGNAKIAKWLIEHAGERVFVVADGAALGAYADRVFKLQADSAGSVTICLPESFEWLLLKSGVVRSDDVAKMLEDPGSHVESRDFASWEQFFAKYLIAATKGTPLAYDKGKLAEGYTSKANADKVMALIACRNVR